METAKHRKHYFEGWYLKHSNGRDSVAFIPGLSLGGSESKAFIQVITDHASYHVPYSIKEYSARGPMHVRVGNCHFTPNGAWIDIDTPELRCRGQVRYGSFIPLRYDFMGPLALLPGLECRHGVVSMGHRLQGELTLNGKILSLYNGAGYIERDWGSSFPDTYLWVQCNEFPQKLCVMAAIATVPLGCLTLPGCVAILTTPRREYRLATYLGAQVLYHHGGGFAIRQGCYTLEAEVEDGRAHHLLAPAGGGMERIIRERCACPAKFRLYDGNRLIIEAHSQRASFEYA